MNIKRRVYDALNVLIAVGLLGRWGNRIGVGEGEIGRRRVREEEKRGVREMVEEKRRRIEEKREML